MSDDNNNTHGHADEVPLRFSDLKDAVVAIPTLGGWPFPERLFVMVADGKAVAVSADVERALELYPEGRVYVKVSGRESSLTDEQVAASEFLIRGVEYEPEVTA